MANFVPGMDLKSIQGMQQMTTPHQLPIRVMGQPRKLRIDDQGAVIDAATGQASPQVSEAEAAALLGFPAPGAAGGYQNPGAALAPRQVIDTPDPFTIVQREGQMRSGQTYGEVPGVGWVEGGAQGADRYRAQSSNPADQAEAFRRYLMQGGFAKMAGGPIDPADRAMAMKEYMGLSQAGGQAGQTRGLDNQTRLDQYGKTVRGPEEDALKVKLQEMQGASARELATMEGQKARDVAKIGRLAARDASIAQLASKEGITAPELNARVKMMGAAQDQNIAERFGGPEGNIPVQGGPRMINVGPQAAPESGQKPSPGERQLSADESLRAAGGAKTLIGDKGGFSADRLASALVENPLILQDPMTRAEVLAWLKTADKGNNPKQRLSDIEKALIRRRGGKDEVGGFKIRRRGGERSAIEGASREIDLVGPGGKALATHSYPAIPLGETGAGLSNLLPTWSAKGLQQQQSEAEQMGLLLQYLHGIR